MTPISPEPLAPWWREAACRRMDPGLFVPSADLGEDARLRHEAAAKAVCARCPVAGACLAEALESGETGVWGGLNDAERRRLVPLGERRLRCGRCGVAMVVSGRGKGGRRYCGDCALVVRAEIVRRSNRESGRRRRAG